MIIWDGTIGRSRAFMQPFYGPSSRNLAAYGRWHAARDNADRSYLDAFRLLLTSSPRAKTVCFHRPFHYFKAGYPATINYSLTQVFRAEQLENIGGFAK